MRVRGSLFGVARRGYRERLREAVGGHVPTVALPDAVHADLEEIAPIQVHLEGEEGQMVRVSLETHVTETGVLELWCVARDGRRWKLEFQVREAGRKRNP